MKSSNIFTRTLLSLFVLTALSLTAARLATGASEDNQALCATFSSGSPIAVGDAPEHIVAGDFNLDGRPDLAVTSVGDDNVAILLGNGRGGFTEANSSPIKVGDAPESVAVGDFNLDGIPDLATANSGSDNVTILRGNGSGGFTQFAGSPIRVEDRPESVAVGDFNLDSRPDLAVANGGDDNVTLLLGNGLGGFTQSTGSPIAVEDDPKFVVVGDFNLDSRSDLAVANYGGDNVTILLGDGFGNFTQPPGSPVVVGNDPESMAVGDFNSDNLPDLAIGNDQSNNVTILLGNGSGGFMQPTGSPVRVGKSPESVTVGDFNLDCKPDLAVSNGDDDNVTILLGNGSGQFTQPNGSPVSVRDDPESVTVGDFNLDGRPDLATANFGDDDVTILLNGCPRTITATIVSRRQGSAGSVATIANVCGGVTPTGGLPVTVVSAPVGIAVTDLTNTEGVITATVAASCAAAVGVNTAALLVADSNNTSSAFNFTVNVLPNTPPTLGVYAVTGAFKLGGALSVTPSASPGDNGVIRSITASAPGFKGDFAVDASTGVVTISNAGPSGNYAVTVTATDDCGASASQTFNLEVSVEAIPLYLRRATLVDDFLNIEGKLSSQEETQFLIEFFDTLTPPSSATTPPDPCGRTPGLLGSIVVETSNIGLAPINAIYRVPNRPPGGLVSARATSYSVTDNIKLGSNCVPVQPPPGPFLQEIAVLPNQNALMATGFGFVEPMQVLINDLTFQQRPQVVGGRWLIQTGPLERKEPDGRISLVSLAEAAPVGKQVSITFRGGDGGETVTLFVRYE
jgi:hypothetical protein